MGLREESNIMMTLKSLANQMEENFKAQREFNELVMEELRELRSMVTNNPQPEAPKSTPKPAPKNIEPKVDNGFDRKKYDATVKKLAKAGKIRLCKSGRPWSEDREIVYKAMGGKKGKDGKWTF